MKPGSRPEARSSIPRFPSRVEKAGPTRNFFQKISGFRPESENNPAWNPEFKIFGPETGRVTKTTKNGLGPISVYNFRIIIIDHSSFPEIYILIENIQVLFA